MFFSIIFCFKSIKSILNFALGRINLIALRGSPACWESRQSADITPYLLFILYAMHGRLRGSNTLNPELGYVRVDHNHSLTHFFYCAVVVNMF